VAAFPSLADNSVMLDRLIAEADAQTESEKLDAERFVREQRILDEQAPPIWKRFRASLKAKCEQYPQRFKFDVCDQNGAVIRGSGRVLEVTFLPDSKVIEFACNGATGFCMIRLNRQNIAVLCDQDGAAYPEDHAVEQLLALILRKSNRQS
jgi:hypothetical protein